MNLSEKIQNEYKNTCLVDKMERPDCILSLCGTPKPFVFIDLDLPGSPLGANDVRCDFLAFVDNVEDIPYVASVEFKSTWRGKMVEQLQAGAKAAERCVPPELECRFRPIGILSDFPKNQRKRVRKFISGPG